MPRIRVRNAKSGLNPQNVHALRSFFACQHQVCVNELDSMHEKALAKIIVKEGGINPLLKVIRKHKKSLLAKHLSHCKDLGMGNTENMSSEELEAVMKSFATFPQSPDKDEDKDRQSPPMIAPNTEETKNPDPARKNRMFQFKTKRMTSFLSKLESAEHEMVKGLRRKGSFGVDEVSIKEIKEETARVEDYLNSELKKDLKSIGAFEVVSSAHIQENLGEDDQEKKEKIENELEASMNSENVAKNAKDVEAAKALKKVDIEKVLEVCARVRQRNSCIEAINLTRKATTSVAVKYPKPEEFEGHYSCFCVSKDNWMRKFCLQLVSNPAFHNFIHLVILFNCLLLLIASPICVHHHTVEEVRSDPRCSDFQASLFTFLFWVDFIFTIIFTFEAIVKMIAQGVLFGKHAYFRSFFNLLDFGVVIAGWYILIKVLFFDGFVTNYGGLRLPRIVRRMVVMAQFQGIQVILHTIERSLYMLRYIVLMIFLCVITASIIGLNLWSGLLEGMCHYDLQAARYGSSQGPLVTFSGNERYILDETSLDAGRTCALAHSSEPNCDAPLGFTTCNSISGGRTCEPVVHQGIYFPRVCKRIKSEDTLGFGYNNFDNIVNAVLTVWTSCTLEGWVTVMYQITDAWGHQGLVAIISISTICFIAFYLMNLTLAIIWKEYESTLQDIRALRLIRHNAALLKDVIHECQEELNGLVSENLKGENLFDELEHEEELEDEAMGDINSEIHCMARAIHEKRAKENADISGLEIKPHWKEAVDAEHSKLRKILIEEAERPFSTFNSFSLVCITVNVITLSLIHANMNPSFENILEAINVGLTIFFGLEVMFRLYALGVYNYFTDVWELMDFFIVSASLLEVAHLESSAISALRSFRALRPLKVVKAMPAVRMLLNALQRSVIDVGGAAWLLFAFVFFFALVAAEFYAGEWDNPSLFEDKPRMNFDTIPWSFVTVFQIMTVENWNDVLWNGMHDQPFISSWFITLIMMTGDWILLNIFVAVLLHRFTEENFADLNKSISTTAKIVKWKRLEKEENFEVPPPKECELALMSEAEFEEKLLKEKKKYKDSMMIDSRKIKVEDETKVSISKKSISKKSIAPVQNDDGRKDSGFEMEYLPKYEFDFRNRFVIPPKGLALFIAERIHSNRYNDTVVSKLSNKSKYVNGREIVWPKNKYERDKMIRNLQIKAHNKSKDALVPNYDGFQRLLQKMKEELTVKTAKLTLSASKIKMQKKVDILKEEIYVMEKALNWAGHNKVRLLHLERRVKKKLKKLQNEELAESNSKVAGYLRFIDNPGASFHSMEYLVKKVELKDKEKPVPYIVNLEEHRQSTVSYYSSNSCGCSSENWIRQKIFVWIHVYPYFEYFIAFLIVISIILAAFEDAATLDCANLAVSHPEYCGDRHKVLFISNCIVTFFFTIEAVFKITAFGFWGPPKSYLRDKWNVFDFVILIFAIFSLFAESFFDVSLQVVKALRAVRILRTIQFLHHVEALRNLANALVGSLPSAALLLAATIWAVFMFGMVGLNLWKGALAECNDKDITEFESCTGKFELKGESCSLLPNENDIHDCLENSTHLSFAPVIQQPKKVFTMDRRWESLAYNFDNIFFSFRTVLEITCGEMWPDIMISVIDAQDENVAMQKGSGFTEITTFLFVVAVIVVCGFMMVNAFVGLVIANYQRMKYEDLDLFALSDDQVEWLDNLRQVWSFRLSFPPLVDSSGWRLRCWCVVTHYYFHVALIVTIVASIIPMCFHHLDMSVEYIDMIKISDIVFTSLFTLESIIKIYVWRLKYFQDRVHNFDVIVVVTGWVSLIPFLGHKDDNHYVGMLSLFRVFRIFRLIGLIRELRRLVVMFFASLPKIASDAFLLLLIMTTYAVVGMQLFGSIKLTGEHINENCNFKTFGASMLALFRAITGESFNGMIHDLELSPPYCEDSTWYDNRAQMERSSNCGYPIVATIYLFSYFFIANFVLLNILIGIIVDFYTDYMARLRHALINERDLEEFMLLWVSLSGELVGCLEKEKLVEILIQTKYPVGLRDMPGLRSDSEFGKALAKRFVTTLDVPVHNNKVRLHETLHALVVRAMNVDIRKDQAPVVRRHLGRAAKKNVEALKEMRTAHQRIDQVFTLRQHHAAELLECHIRGTTTRRTNVQSIALQKKTKERGKAKEKRKEEEKRKAEEVKIAMPMQTSPEERRNGGVKSVETIVLPSVS
eukprot:g1923.t1